jgi:hypothetical protein
MTILPDDLSIVTSGGIFSLGGDEQPIKIDDANRQKRSRLIGLNIKKKRQLCMLPCRKSFVPASGDGIYRLENFLARIQ